MKKLLLFLTFFCAITNNLIAQTIEFNLDEGRLNGNRITRINPDKNLKIVLKVSQLKDLTEALEHSFLMLNSDPPDTNTLKDYLGYKEPYKSARDINNVIKENFKDGSFTVVIDTTKLNTLTFDTMSIVFALKGKPLDTLRLILRDTAATSRPVTRLELPPSTLSGINLAGSIQNTRSCGYCDNTGDLIEYNFATNNLQTIIYKKDRSDTIKNGKWLSNIARVGRPLTFAVKNINPFRDSVMISDSMVSFVDEASLMKIANLFDLSQVATQHSMGIDSLQRNCLGLLADVIALGKQIQLQKQRLADLSECASVCEEINRIKDTVERYFEITWKYPRQTEESLELFVIRELNCMKTAIADSATRKKMQDSVVAILSEYYTFRNAKNYFFYKIPQLQNVDEYLFHLTIVPKKGVVSHSIVNNKPISVPLISGFKVDASTGLFITGLLDHRYTLKPDSSVIHNSYGGDSIVYNRRNQIITQQNGKVDFGVSALIHFYPRITPYVNLSVSLGAGLSIGPDPAIRYLAGVSLLLGRNGRLVLSYGCAAGYVKRLADGYRDMDFVPTADKDMLTKKVFAASSFGSLTFSIPIFKTKVDTAKD